MMEFKGTPGKWILDTAKDSDGQISEIYILQDGGGCIICVNNGDDNYDIPCDLANANLICAAPDLLEALQGLLKLKELYIYYDKEEDNPAYLVEAQAVNSAIKQAEQAIQKALIK